MTFGGVWFNCGRIFFVRIQKKVSRFFGVLFFPLIFALAKKQNPRWELNFGWRRFEFFGLDGFEKGAFERIRRC
jgi:hypothetical protein